MNRSVLVFAVCMLSFVVVFGCKSSKQEAPASAPAPQAQPAAPVERTGGDLTGKVVETMNSGGYTYVSLENKGQKLWVALPQTTVKVGQKLTCQPGMVMNNFTSKTLNRTFDSIIFSGGVR
jgi:hypothetical protein